jgi:hypothetical protein
MSALTRLQDALFRVALSRKLQGPEPSWVLFLGQNRARLMIMDEKEGLLPWALLRGGGERAFHRLLDAGCNPAATSGHGSAFDALLLSHRLHKEKGQPCPGEVGSCWRMLESLSVSAPSRQTLEEGRRLMDGYLKELYTITWDPNASNGSSNGEVVIRHVVTTADLMERQIRQVGWEEALRLDPGLLSAMQDFHARLEFLMERGPCAVTGYAGGNPLDRPLGFFEQTFLQAALPEAAVPVRQRRL